MYDQIHLIITRYPRSSVCEVLTWYLQWVSTYSSRFTATILVPCLPLLNLHDSLPTVDATWHWLLNLFSVCHLQGILWRSLVRLLFPKPQGKFWNVEARVRGWVGFPCWLDWQRSSAEVLCILVGHWISFPQHLLTQQLLWGAPLAQLLNTKGVEDYVYGLQRILTIDIIMDTKFKWVNLEEALIITAVTDKPQVSLAQHNLIAQQRDVQCIKKLFQPMA